MGQDKNNLHLSPEQMHHAFTEEYTQHSYNACKFSYSTWENFTIY